MVLYCHSFFCISGLVVSIIGIVKAKKNNGQFIGSVAPFEYKKDPNNKHKFIIDKKAARIVKKVFAMILDGKSKRDVVDELNKMQILPPALYKIDEGLYNYDIKETAKKWDAKKIDKILKNQSYTGDLVQGKRKRKNNDTDCMNIFKKKEKINELNRLLIDELIEDIVVSEDGNIKVIFKYEDKYFEALDFINKQKYDIILSS